MKHRPTPQEVENVLQHVTAAVAVGSTGHHNDSYEAGVLNALVWILGDERWSAGRRTKEE